MGEPERQHVVVVAAGWGASSGEAASVTRLMAGAVALHARVSVVSLDDRAGRPGAPPRRRRDGPFTVHSAQAPASRRQLADLLETSIRRQPHGELPDAAVRGLLRLSSRPSREALGAVLDLEPDTVVLAGPETFFMGEPLPVGTGRPRVVVLPLGGRPELLGSHALRPLVAAADAVVAVSETERSRLAPLLPAGREDRLRLVRPVYPVNRGAAAAGMAGMASFGRYLLVLSGFPPDEPSSGRCPAHDYLRQVLGPISVVEVCHGRWRVTDAERRHDVVWPANRMNLWRLMARAAATLEVRPAGPVGREAIESLLFATPVVVPAGTVAAEHAAASNGGLWYRDPGEMLDALKALLDDGALRDAIGSQGRRWAERQHGDMAAFAEEATVAVLG
ncbi:MAG: glycosyltransferase [Actinomycetota bacterium]|nr:glycosyltransferase [Actinomycetota bacterium]